MNLRVIKPWYLTGVPIAITVVLYYLFLCEFINLSLTKQKVYAGWKKPESNPGCLYGKLML